MSEGTACRLYVGLWLLADVGVVYIANVNGRLMPDACMQLLQRGFCNACKIAAATRHCSRSPALERSASITFTAPTTKDV